MAFSYRLNKAILASPYSKKEFAHLVGVSPAAVTQWTKGLTMPETPRLLLIARTLAVPLGYLFSETSDRRSLATELAAWEAFERLMAERGPRTVLAMLEATPEPGSEPGA